MRTSLTLLALFCLVSCRSTLPGGLPRARITVDPGTGPAPHRISAAGIRPHDPKLRPALERAGVGLRVAGDRQGLLLRYASLDPAAESVLTEALELEAAFSRSAPFGPGDTLEIRAMKSPPESRGFIINVVPHRGIAGLDIGVIARPPNGALLPVIRGYVPLTGSGALLLTGEANGRPAFATLLRLELEGEAAVGSVVTPEKHSLTVDAYVLSNDAVTRTLTRMQRKERGGEGGIAEYAVSAHEVGELVRLLASESDSGPTDRHRLKPGRTVAWSRGRLHLKIRTQFSLADFSYDTQITDRPPRKVRHGERDAILVVGWDADRPGRSVVAIIRIRPEE